MTRDDTIRELFAKDKTDEEIGAALGLASGTIRKLRRPLGLLRPRGRVENLAHGTPDRQLDREYIRSRYTGPESVGHIAEALHAHPETVERILRKEFGIYIIGPPVPPDPEALKRADEMLDGTIPYKEVADTVGMKTEAVKGRFPGRGLSRSNYGAYLKAKQLEKGLGL